MPSGWFFNPHSFRLIGFSINKHLGRPMGFPLSSILANIVLEEQALEKLSIRSPIYYRYVNDFAVLYEVLNDILTVFILIRYIQDCSLL